MQGVAWWRRIGWPGWFLLVVGAFIVYGELFPHPMLDWKPYWWTFEQQPRFGSTYTEAVASQTSIGALRPESGGPADSAYTVATLTLWLTRRPLHVRYHFVHNHLRSTEFDAGYFFWPQGEIYLRYVTGEIARRYGSARMDETVESAVHVASRTWAVPRGEVVLTLRRNGTDEFVRWVYQEDPATRAQRAAGE